MTDHRKLRVWQLSQEVAELVWRESLRRDVPRPTAAFVQVRASVDSISANIAEGNGRTAREFANFVRIALGSANETDSHVALLMKRGYFDIRAAHRVRDDLAAIRRMLIRLQAALLDPTCKHRGTSR
jgi:four helix bundle protein